MLAILTCLLASAFFCQYSSTKFCIYVKFLVGKNLRKFNQNLVLNLTKKLQICSIVHMSRRKRVLLNDALGQASYW